MPLDGDPREVALDPMRSGHEIYIALKHLARSAEEADHEALRAGLSSPAILDRIDDAEAYHRAPREQLRVAGVMDALSKNTSPAAQKTVTVLAEREPYLAQRHRLDLLILATPICRPPAQPVQALWDANTDPRGAQVELVALALAANATEPAATRFVKLASNRESPVRVRTGWFRRYAIRTRTQIPMIVAATGFVGDAGVEPELRANAAWAYFDWQESWYGAHRSVEPAAWSVTKREARDAARKLADQARSALSPLDPVVEAAISAALAQFDVMDAG
jgi:hypothetical protein